MIKYLSAFIIFLSLSYNLAAQTYTIETVPNDHLLDSCDYVTNPDKILAPNAEAELNQIIQKIKDSTTAEVAVVLLNSIGNEDIDEFATKLFNYWGIGKSQNNNGLLFIVVMDVREMVFRTGYGLEGVLPDITLAQIIRNIVVPEFKSGRYYFGIINAINSIYDCLTEPNAIDEIKALDKVEVETKGWSTIIWEISKIIAYGFFGASFFLCILSAIIGKRERKNHKNTNTNTQPETNNNCCSNCNEEMNKLDDYEKIEHLTEAQKTEERINSMRHNVWICQHCKTTKTESFLSIATRMSLYFTCPNCGANAFFIKDKVIIKPPSKHSYGIRADIYQCLHCGFEQTEETIINYVSLENTSPQTTTSFSYTNEEEEEEKKSEESSTTFYNPPIPSTTTTSSSTDSNTSKSNTSSSSKKGGSWGGGKTGGGGARGSW